MTSGTLSGIMTISAFLAFLGVAFWAYSPKRKQDFDSAAQLPLQDEPVVLHADQIAQPTNASPARTRLNEKDAK